MATAAQRARRRRARARRSSNKQGGQLVQGQQNRGGNGGARKRSAPVSKNDEVACAFANPFCSPEGLKWPDSSSARTLAWRERYRATLYVDPTNFVGAAYFFPRLAVPIYPAPNLTGTAPNENFPVISLGTPVDWPDNPGNALPVKAMRVVNFGVRIRYIGPSLYARGLMTLSTLEGDATSEFPTTPSEYAVEKQTYAIIPGMDIVWIAKPLSNSAREFQVDSSSSATSSWTALALFYEGLDANTETGLHVEVLSHFELLPSTGGTLTHASTPAAKSNPGIITSVSNALLSLPSSMEKFGDAVHSAGQLAQVLRSYRTQPLMLMNS